jgi:hypothetical protein
MIQYLYFSLENIPTKYKGKNIPAPGSGMTGV